MLTVDDGNDLAAIDRAIAAARAETNKPSLIKVRTVIGYGSPNKAGTAECHGSPLGVDEARLTKEALGWPGDLFFAVPERVREQYAGVAAGGAAARGRWEELFAGYEREYPDLARQWKDAMAGRLPEGWKDKLPVFAAGEKVATRSASGKVLNALAAVLPTLVGGSADLAPSNNTYLAGLGDFEAGEPGGRNLRFGVREHAMGGILNGMAYHGGVFPFGGTFFVFTDYMRPAIRLAALSGLPVTYVFTHDSVALGEDGPTHQPIEHLASLRAMPNLVLIRPSDAAETVVAWQAALERREGPTALVLTRQNLPVLDRTVLAPAEGLVRGGYVLQEAAGGRPDVILIATGSEVEIALQAAGVLSGHERGHPGGGAAELGAVRGSRPGLQGGRAAGGDEGPSGDRGGGDLRLGEVRRRRWHRHRHRPLWGLRAGRRPLQGIRPHRRARGCTRFGVAGAPVGFRRGRFAAQCALAAGTSLLTSLSAA